jgi:glycosyltransferase involved in cell wall biosynthesis
MNILPKISIQIPTYNQQHYIEKAVESALMQTYENIEIIIADDCSTDNTQEILKKYESNDKVKYYRNNKNIGRVANYHKALYEHCTGDWVVNLDGDDYFTDAGFIKYAVQLISKNNDGDINVFQGNHNLKKIKKIFPHSEEITNNAVIIDGAEYFLNFYKVQHFTHCATLFKRSKALELNFYSFDCLFTDFNSMSKLFLMGKIIISGKKVAMWRWDDNNQSAGLTEQNLYKELDSISDIANFAKRFFAIETITDWKNRMNNYMETTYIELLIHKPKDVSSLKYIFKKFKWDIIYLKQLVKYLIRA